MFQFQSRERGFTLNEILVVVAIISILSSIVLFSVQSARASARDKERVAMVEQLGLAMRLYVEQEGTSEVDCTSGIKIDGSRDVEILGNNTPGGSCEDGDEILEFLENHFGTVPSDPLGPDDADHYYYFDSAHDCDIDQTGRDVQRPLVFAVRLERMDENARDVCDEDAGNDGGYTDGKPYVKRLDFITSP